MNKLTVNDTYQEMAEKIHRANVAVGWWDVYLPDKKLLRYETAMMLVISEAAEALEGFRKDLKDDHLPDHPMFNVEIADCAIRLLDLAGAYNERLPNLDQMNLHHEHAGLVYLRGKSPPEQLFYFCTKCTDGDIQAALIICAKIAHLHRFSLKSLIVEKCAYNTKRLDHKREVRNKKGGKKI